jgi:S1-C subfamily serine protease
LAKVTSPTIAWLRNNIKSVESKEEQSAYGLNTPGGVIMVSIWKGSPVVQEGGLKRGDVILEVEGAKVKDVKSFLKILKENNESETLNIVVMRNQSEQNLMIHLK